MSQDDDRQSLDIGKAICYSYTCEIQQVINIKHSKGYMVGEEEDYCTKVQFSFLLVVEWEVRNAGQAYQKV